MVRACGWTRARAKCVTALTSLALSCSARVLCSFSKASTRFCRRSLRVVKSVQGSRIGSKGVGFQGGTLDAAARCRCAPLVFVIEDLNLQLLNAQLVLLLCVLCLLLDSLRVSEEAGRTEGSELRCASPDPLTARAAALSPRARTCIHSLYFSMSLQRKAFSSSRWPFCRQRAGATSVLNPACCRSRWSAFLSCLAIRARSVAKRRTHTNARQAVRRYRGLALTLSCSR